MSWVFVPQRKEFFQVVSDPDHAMLILGVDSFFFVSLMIVILNNFGTMLIGENEFP